jgi:hypothetical protein
MSNEIITFKEVVSSVEQRFRRVYKGETVGTAKIESKMEFEEVSTGWWLVLRNMGIALRIGETEPAIADGDDITISISKG